MMNRRSFVAGSALAGSVMAGAPALAAQRAGGGRFPPKFLWGASTAGHQVEGNNTNSDQWLLENVQPTITGGRSGDAANSLERWSDDLDLARAIGLNSYRFSLEWARIEPEQGLFSLAMLDHYRAEIAGCRARGLVPVVTFSHFSAPRWFAAQGGWTHPQAPDLFARFCERAARHLGADIGYALTLNEPNIARLLPLVLPPQFLDGLRANLAAAARAAGVPRFVVANTVPPEDVSAVNAGMLRGHRMGRAAIKGVRPDLPVGVSLAMADDQVAGDRAGGGGTNGAGSLRDVKRAELYGDWLDAARGDDFVGVQNYERNVWDARGKVPPPAGGPRNFRGAEVYAPSLAGAVRYAHEAARVPVLVTEHGVGTDDDRIRAAFIADALRHLKAAMDAGVPVLGYMHWSLIDNYEWGAGNDAAKFGLASVDRTTWKRTPKPSAGVLGAIARANAL